MTYYHLRCRHLLVVLLGIALILVISLDQSTGVAAKNRCCKRKCCDLLIHKRDKRDANATVAPNTEIKADASVKLENPAKSDAKPEPLHGKSREKVKEEDTKLDESKRSSTSFEPIHLESRKEYEDRGRRLMDTHKGRNDNYRDSQYYRDESPGSPEGCDPDCVKSSLLYSDCNSSNGDYDDNRDDDDIGRRRNWWKRCYKRSRYHDDYYSSGRRRYYDDDDDDDDDNDGYYPRRRYRRRGWRIW